MYIHERENWWQFRYDAEAVLTALSPVRAKQGLLMGKLSTLGFDVQTSATLRNLSLDILKSSEIEGEILNAEQVRSSIAKRFGLDTAGLPSSSRYIDGIVEMMIDATMNCQEPLTEDRLMGWHNVLFPNGFSGPYKIDVAKYRSGEMQVVSGAFGREQIHYQAPAPERVRLEMLRLIDYINSSTSVEPIIKSAIAHFWFVSIHPFDDGNGRIARAITDMLLARSDNSRFRFYSMSNAINAERSNYYDILEKAQHGDGDLTEWLLWFIARLDESLDHTNETLQSALSKNEFWERNRETSINQRQQKIINMLLDGFDDQMTTGRWSRICHCSRDTALADASDLVNKGILMQVGKGRSVHYILSQHS